MSLAKNPFPYFLGAMLGLFVACIVIAIVEDRMTLPPPEPRACVELNHKLRDPRNKYEIEAYGMAGKRGGQCVEFVQIFFHYFSDCQDVNCFDKPFRGAARDIPVDTGGVVKPGIAVLTNEGPQGHAAVVLRIDWDPLYQAHFLILAESNYHGDGMVEVGRRLRVDSRVIRGYYDFSK